jgi:ATP-binding cassette subfamily B protein
MSRVREARKRRCGVGERRYVCVRQNDHSDCGAAALATVARHHRLPVGLERLRDLTGTDRQGTSLLGLLRAAVRLGFRARGVKGTYEALPRAPLPAIAHLRTAEGLGHFVVLHQVRKDAVVIADPGGGVARLRRDEFCRHWTGYLLLVLPEQTAPAGGAGTIPATTGHFPGRSEPCVTS